MTPARHCLQMVLLVGISAGEIQAQRFDNWRVYKDADGLKVSHTTGVAVGPKGTVLAKHGVDAISVLDGYSVMSIPMAAVGNYRLHQSRSEQIWTQYSEGLLAYKEDKWSRYPLPEIRAEHRPISLVPAEIDHVLFLLSDRLMEYAGASNQTRLIRHVQQTRLERFFDMTAARDGGAWITGQEGLAKLPPPIRKLTPESEWTEYLTDLPVQNLQRPFEDDQGGITAVAESLTTRKRVLVHFDLRSWQTHGLPGENILQAWRDVDQSFWVRTVHSLLHLANGNLEVMKKEGLLAGSYFDAATQTNGVFWLATSEGLVRHAPFTWRTPESLTGVNTLVHAIQEDPSGRLWCASSDALTVLEANRTRRFPLPEEFEAGPQTPRSLASLSAGRMAMSLNDRLYRFDLQTEKFDPILHPTGKAVKLLGQVKADWCVLTYTPNASEFDGRLEIFDGARFVPYLETPSPWAAPEDVAFLFSSQRGEVWLGGASGVAVFRDGKWHVFGRADGFFGDEVLCLLETDDGKIWCGGHDRIAEYDGRKWSTVRIGLDQVNAMIKSRGSIWIATRAGVYRYFKGSWVLNAVDEGLPSSAIQIVYEDRRARLWAGTSLGVSRYDPDVDNDPPRTVIVKTDQKIKAPADGIITLSFGGRDKWKFTQPDRLLFSYRVDDGAWSPFAAPTSVSLTNLAGGAHRLFVKAMDRNWNEEPEPSWFEFSVVAPWFKDPRLVGITLFGLVIILFLAGLAVNRHLRLVRSYAEVEQIVALRSRELELANQELLHSQKMKALGTLAAGIAHDFNNILSIIKGSAQIIEANPGDPEKVRHRLDRIKTVVNQGAGLVKAMLGYTRAGGKNLAPCHLNRVVEDAIKLLGDRFLQGTRVQLEAVPDLPLIFGSGELIQQMLVNLMLNASDAMAEGGSIILRTGKMSLTPPDPYGSGGVSLLPSHLVLAPGEAKSYLFISVQDFGYGIAPDVLPRIFEPFFTTKALSAKRGTGLGLSMVYEFAKEMGYGLTVASIAGQGSTFTIIIPEHSPPPAKEPNFGA